MHSCTENLVKNKSPKIVFWNDFLFPLKLKVTCDLGKSYCLKKCHYYLIASDVLLRAAVLEISRNS